MILRLILSALVGAAVFAACVVVIFAKGMSDGPNSAFPWGMVATIIGSGLVLVLVLVYSPSLW